jgi:hypothetical protein
VDARLEQRRAPGDDGQDRDNTGQHDK